MSVKGKRAIVTGSTRGIGLAIARLLIQSGADVVISSRRPDMIDETVRQLNQVRGGKAKGQPCDVRRPDQIEELIAFCARCFGGLDILVNNAGIGIFRNVEELSIQEWQETLRTNLDGVFYACHFAIPEMKKAGGGFIVNIGSLAGKNAFPGGAAYNASKFGLTGFSEALMQEVRHQDIRVACIMPGSVRTDFASGSESGKDSWKLAPEDVAEVVLQILTHPARCLTSRVEMRPSKPPGQ